MFWYSCTIIKHVSVVNNCLERVWKDVNMSDLRYCASVYREGLWKMVNIFCHDSLCHTEIQTEHSLKCKLEA